MHAKRWLDFSQIRICSRISSPRSGHIYMKDSQSDEKSISDFSVFFIFWVMAGFSSVSPTKIVQKGSNSQERCAMSCNEWKINFQIFPIFNFLGMVNFVLKFRNNFMLVGLCPLNLPFLLGASRKKILFNSGQIFRKDTYFSENHFLAYEFFLCEFYFSRYGRFCIWEILYQEVKYLHENRLYTKSTISQKLEVAQEKLMN